MDINEHITNDLNRPILVTIPTFKDYLAEDPRLIVNFLITIISAMIAVFLLIVIQVIFDLVVAAPFDIAKYYAIIDISIILLILILSVPFGYIIFEWINFRMTKNHRPQSSFIEDQDDEIMF